ncbi:MAG TPA: hypothetical protein VGR41_01450 [Actinomycetota bacterium]|nr:hypothetical protein [Actinomycetota bacterium]
MVYSAAFALVLTSGVALLVGLASEDGTSAILIGLTASVGALVLLATGVARTLGGVSSSER